MKITYELHDVEYLSGNYIVLVDKDKDVEDKHGELITNCKNPMFYLEKRIVFVSANGEQVWLQGLFYFKHAFETHLDFIEYLNKSETRIWRTLTNSEQRWLADRQTHKPLC